jgi:sialate O-acetylesterase
MITKDRRVPGLAICLILCGTQLFAEITMPSIFGDHMVIQQNSVVPFWGRADPGERITIRASWLTADTSILPDDRGEWMVRLNSPGAGGPFEITFSGTNEILLKDILAGEVWLASGQSNMAMALNSCDNAESETASATYPGIRLFHIERISATEPMSDCRGSWKACTPESAQGFSAAAYYFARKIHKELDVPVGVISASKGGSPAESWLAPEAIRNDSSLWPVFRMWEEWEEQASQLTDKIPEGEPVPESLDMVSKPHRRPGALYNAMIAPIIPFTIKGVIWYQGENNVSRPLQYERLFKTLIQQWRREWLIGDFPFYYVQITPFHYEGHVLNASLLRESQYRCGSLPNTGMVTTTDLGDLNDSHPKNKKDVGMRLARWALANTYGFRELDFSGPVFKSMDIRGGSVYLTFDHAETGLVGGGDSLTEFSIAGSDRSFHPAFAVIRNDTVVLHHPLVGDPVATRFAWMINRLPDLYNKEGLPAVPFRTDRWNMPTH